MSVLVCDRVGCERIMCDNFSPKHGYICYDCMIEYDELKEDIDIEEFMKRDKSSMERLEYHFKEDIYEEFTTT